MKAVILAAGLGTRLREITGEDLPKVMVPVGGQPLLLRTIAQLKDQGFTEFYMNTHYLPHVITDYFGDGSKFGVSILYSHEPELLESGGAIKKMEPWLDEDFVMIYGDVFHNLDMQPIVELYRREKPFGVVVVKETIHVPQSDIVEVDTQTQKIIAIHTRPHNLQELQPGLFATSGIYVWSKEILDFIPAGQKVHLDRETIPALVKAGKMLLAWPKKESDIIVDIGKPDNYEKVQKMFEEA